MNENLINTIETIQDQLKVLKKEVETATNTDDTINWLIDINKAIREESKTLSSNITSFRYELKRQ